MVLFCAEYSVSGIAETRTDICVFVKLSVDVTDVKGNIRMSSHKLLNTHRSTDDSHELDVPSATLLDEINGCNS